LTLLGIILAAGSFLAASRGFAISQTTTQLWDLSFQTVLAFWVRADRRSRQFTAPFEFDAFVFFAWPVVLPYYFYRTRGGIGLLATLGVYFLFLAPFAIATIAGVMPQP